MRAFLLVAALLAIVAMREPARAADPLPPSPDAVTVEADGVNVVIAPYAWAAGLSGTTGLGIGPLPPVEINESFADILRNLNFAAFVSAEIEYRRFVGFTDLQYVNLLATAPTPFGLLGDRVKLRTHQLSWIATGGYRVVDVDRGTVDVLAGGRLWNVSNRLNLSGSPINRSAERTQTWVDPIVGVKGTLELTPSFSLVGWGFAGGFGAASDFSWDVLGAIGWSPRKNVSLFVGYRAQAVDYSNDGFVFDVIQQGPLIGGAIRF